MQTLSHPFDAPILEARRTIPGGRRRPLAAGTRLYSMEAMYVAVLFGGLQGSSVLLVINGLRVGRGAEAVALTAVVLLASLFIDPFLSLQATLVTYPVRLVVAGALHRHIAGRWFDRHHHARKAGRTTPFVYASWWHAIPLALLAALTWMGPALGVGTLLLFVLVLLGLA